MDYFQDDWIGFLSNFIISNCIKACKDRCPGCDIKLRSPLLHKHEQFSLLEKIRTHFDEVRGELSPYLGEIYDVVQHKLPHGEDLKEDKERYCIMGHNFFALTCPDSLYWGRYITEYNDDIIFEMLKLCIAEGKRLESLNKTCTPKPSKRKPKITKTKNSVI